MLFIASGMSTSPMMVGRGNKTMQLYPGAEMIECEINGRPLYLPLLREGRKALLLDCGTKHHAQKDIPGSLSRLGVAPEDVLWLVITHPDGDHCGGSAEFQKLYPNCRIACGEEDRALIESPDYLYSFRYNAYRKDHGICFDPVTEQAIRNCSSKPQAVAFTFTGGETLRLGPDRVLEVWHLPGHSHGHLGLFDTKHGTLFYGDAIQGAGYRSLAGHWTLCPTYLYVEPYLQTIRTIETSRAGRIVGCHWPVLRSRQAILQFCAESRNFVSQADRLIRDYLSRHDSGVSLRELCERLSDELGDWPSEVRFELANAFSGHLDYGVQSGRIEVDTSHFPFLYCLKKERHQN
jgi:glyoxylase-like metal-dependent hydrolase (beta-lactamase superfamily II)